MTKDRLIACLISIALGASMAFALPCPDDTRCSNRLSAPKARVDSSRRRFNWRAFVEAMLPPSIRAKARTAPPTAEVLESIVLVDDLAGLSRFARRATGRRS